MPSYWRRPRRTYGCAAAIGREAPLLVPGLKAWFDTRELAAGALVSITSRAGSMGPVVLERIAPGSEPVVLDSAMNGKPAIYFNGLTSLRAPEGERAAWTFLHDGTGAAVWSILRCHSTGAATQTMPFSTATASVPQVGVNLRLTNSNILDARILNGVVISNMGSFSDAPITSRDVNKWLEWGYITGTQTVAATGIVKTSADSAAPSPSIPSRQLTVGGPSGGSSNFFTGLYTQFIVYDHPLTTDERALLAQWSHDEYGVAV